MKTNCHPLFLASLVFLNLGIFATDAFGLLVPFSKERIAAAGKHCVHGYDGNLGQVGTYYAGNASALNQYVLSLGETSRAPETSYATKVVTLHPGPMVVPEYLNPKSDISTDWLVTTWRGDSAGEPSWHIQIDVWLGGKIKLDELRIPKGFVVKSGREIEGFVARHSNQSDSAEQQVEDGLNSKAR